MKWMCTMDYLKNQLSNDTLELVALAGMEIPRTNEYQNYFTPATYHLIVLICHFPCFLKVAINSINTVFTSLMIHIKLR